MKQNEGKNRLYSHNRRVSTFFAESALHSALRPDRYEFRMTPEHTEVVRRQISQLMQTLIQVYLISAEGLPECTDAHNCSGELIDKIVHIRNETRRLRPIPASVPGQTRAILTRKAWLEAMPGESGYRPVIDIELISAWQQQQHRIHKLQDAWRLMKAHLDSALMPHPGHLSRICKMDQ
jgi:hypothetical protein